MINYYYILESFDLSVTLYLPKNSKVTNA